MKIKIIILENFGNNEIQFFFSKPSVIFFMLLKSLKSFSIRGFLTCSFVFLFRFRNLVVRGAFWIWSWIKNIYFNYLDKSRNMSSFCTWENNKPFISIIRWKSLPPLISNFFLPLLYENIFFPKVFWRVLFAKLVKINDYKGKSIHFWVKSIKKNEKVVSWCITFHFSPQIIKDYSPALPSI